MEQPDALNELAMGFSAYRGYKTYQATGDPRQGVGMGLATYGGLYLMGVGAGFFLMGLFFAIFWLPFLTISGIAALFMAWGWSSFRRTNHSYRAITSPQYHRVPPPVPAEAELSAGGYTYGYDLSTGRFTRTPAVPELPPGR